MPFWNIARRRSSAWGCLVTGSARPGAALAPRGGVNGCVTSRARICPKAYDSQPEMRLYCLHCAYTENFRVNNGFGQSPKKSWKSIAYAGATRRIRTDDLLITNQLLYRLS